MWRFYQYNYGVTAEYDLNLLPIYRIKGQELPQLPGLLAATPPKHTARGRESDHLLIYLTISGNTAVSSSEYSHISAQMAQRFYSTQGSLTFAVKAAADWLNQFLLKRNLSTTGKGQYIVGRLILAALRGGQCVVAQCGPTHIFQLSGTDTRQVHDPEIAGHGLGIGQNTAVYLASLDLHADDLLLLCPDLPAGWEGALQNERDLSPDMLHRRLLGLGSDDLNAVLVQTRKGRGNFLILKPSAPVPQKTSPAVSPAQVPSSVPPVAFPPAEPQPAPHPTAQIANDRQSSRFSRLIAGQGSADSTAETPVPVSPSAETQPADTVSPVQPPAEKHIPSRVIRQPVQPPSREKESSTNRMGRFISPRSSGDIPEIKRPPSPRRQKTFRGLAKVIGGVRAFAGAISNRLGGFLPRLAPAGESRSDSGGSGWLLAVVIPVVMVAIGWTVYSQYGRTARYKTNYELAVQQAAQARGQTDPTEVRRLWDSTIYYLDEAEKSLTNQTGAVDLRQEAQTALDNLDGILRLDFRPAIAGWQSHTYQITQIGATDTDLYFLDSATGTIHKATLANQVYDSDLKFKCGPGTYDGTTVDKLIGFVTLPMSNKYNARLMGMDAGGRVLYCGLSDPVAQTLVQPQLGLRKIAAFTLDSDSKDLYVLDPASNAVWKYNGDYGQFSIQPTMFFGQQVPQGMATAIALAVNSGDLYLLFQDGHVTACPLNAIQGVPMRCTDPATFKDTRPERQPGPHITDAIFTQMTFASVPDPSLYMLEPLTRAVYRFSPRSDSLELRGQFRATISEEKNPDLMSGPATAMTIGPNRYLFISTGDQIFFATDVP